MRKIALILMALLAIATLVRALDNFKNTERHAGASDRSPAPPR